MSEIDHITGRQIAAGRVLAGLAQDELAAASKISVSTLRRMEACDGPAAGLPNNVAAVRAALQGADVEFIHENGGGPGVRLRKAGKRADDHPKPVGPATDVVHAMDAAITKDRSRLKRDVGAEPKHEPRAASVKETGEEVPQEQWERFEAADKKPTQR